MTGRVVPLLLLGGFLIWSSAFVVLYVANSVGCAFAWDQMSLAGPVTVQRSVLIVAWLLHLGAFLPLVALLRGSAGNQPGAGALETAAWLSTIGAAAATVWIGVPVIWTTECV